MCVCRAGTAKTLQAGLICINAAWNYVFMTLSLEKQLET